MNESINTELLSDKHDLSNFYRKEIAKILGDIPFISINQTSFAVSQVRKIASQSPKLIFITAKLINHEQMQECKGLVKKMKKKELLKETRIILCSNWIAEADKQSIMESGVNDWIDANKIKSELPKIIEGLKNR